MIGATLTSNKTENPSLDVYEVASFNRMFTTVPPEEGPVEGRTSETFGSEGSKKKKGIEDVLEGFEEAEHVTVVVPDADEGARTVTIVT